jgi:Domain of unknown function (DUF1906)
LKSIGVSTVIRYYDWENETLPGKTLTAAELNLIKRNHLSVAVVFQHHNDLRTTFETASRGRTDARRSLYLASAFNQHAGSAIYFGVDGVFQPNLVDRYFKEINSEFATNKANIGYSIGIYGSGRDCDQILSQRLAKYCWLANAKSWPGYDSLERSGRWSVKQFTPTKDCFGQEVDLNKVNLSRSRDFGQWRPRGIIFKPVIILQIHAAGDTILGLRFNVQSPYSAGHVCTKGDVRALHASQTFR